MLTLLPQPQSLPYANEVTVDRRHTLLVVICVFGLIEAIVWLAPGRKPDWSHLGVWFFALLNAAMRSGVYRINTTSISFESLWPTIFGSWRIELGRVKQIRIGSGLRFEFLAGPSERFSMSRLLLLGSYDRAERLVVRALEHRFNLSDVRAARSPQQLIGNFIVGPIGVLTLTIGGVVALIAWLSAASQTPGGIAPDHQLLIMILIPAVLTVGGFATHHLTDAGIRRWRTPRETVESVR
ncbi:MAG: hypothetical protein QM770_06445 [Tepidisphaeraceae bacterium]